MNYIYLDEIDSTNNEIKRLAAKGYSDKTVVSADTQTNGRGRQGHTWESPKGTSIATSILIRPSANIEITHIPRITILSALAVCDALEKASGIKTEIKWPNDVLLDHKKVSGILTELCFMPENTKAFDSEYSIIFSKGSKYIVCGIGVNVTTNDFPDEIKDMATSILLSMKEHGMSDEKISALSKKSIIEDIWENFISYYKEFEKTESLEFIKEQYERRLVNIGKRVRIFDPKGEYEATALGIDVAGRLLIETGENEYKAVDSGEVMVRGIYGYV